MRKITIIGAGSVGSAIANNMMTMGIATEILMIDVNKPRPLARRWTCIRRYVLRTGHRPQR